MTPEHKRKIGEANKLRTTQFYQTPEGKKRAQEHSSFMKGKTLSDAHRNSIKENAVRGENNHSWKGNDVGYRGLHHWVVATLGKPKKCESCCKDGLTGRQIHWYNISGKYHRDTTDWVRLCGSCHREVHKKDNPVTG